MDLEEIISFIFCLIYNRMFIARRVGSAQDSGSDSEFEYIDEMEEINSIDEFEKCSQIESVQSKMVS